MYEKRRRQELLFGWTGAVFLEDGIAGDDAFELMGVGAIDHGDERIVIHIT
jgi:hypothetical protein